MSSKKKSRKSLWRGMTPFIGGREWLRALALMGAMALAAFAASALSPARETGQAALPVVVQRVMTSNPSACFGVDGEYYDWLELKNASDDAVNLRGWRLTDTGDIRDDSCVFGDIPLAPGESLRVYCHERPEGYAGDALFSGFRLSADGVVLTLCDPLKRINTLVVPELRKTDVYQRDDATGRYAAVSFERALGMDEGFTRTLTPDYDPEGLMISEIMPVNRSTLQDEDGDYSDWIELFNGSDRPVPLLDYILSDDDANHLKWRFPERTIQPGEYLVVFASGKDRRPAEGALHTGFRLSGNGEALRLYNPEGDVVSYVEYDAAVADQSLSRTPEGRITTGVDPSPGHENTDFGAREAMAALTRSSLGVYINEVCALGKGADWLELYNASDRAADLSGMGLSDDPARPRKWQFPAGARLQPGGYALVMLPGGQDAANADPAEAPAIRDASGGVVPPNYTADFGLASGETVCLSTPEGGIVDRIKLYDQRRNVSFGRAEGHDRCRYFTSVTPGAANAAKSYARAATDVRFSPAGGVVREKRIELQMSSSPGVNIYYTTDGSEPTASSKIYSGPITLDANTRVKAVAWSDDAIPSDTAVGTYIFGQHSLRLVCISGKRSELNGSTGTLNTGAKKEGYTVFAEMYEPDGTQLVAQSCHLELTGHHSRTNNDQRSFRLTARRETGDTRFRAALFTNRDYDEYKSVVIRASGQDCLQTHMRDSILAALAADTGLLYQETEVCVVYVNGEYWGLYNMRERIDPHSICQFEGWEEPDDVSLVERTGSAAYATQGSVAGYKEMLRWVRSHDMSRDENVEQLRKSMDIENYLDYVALEMYTCNQDLGNVRLYSSREDPRWKWALFDLDLSYQIDRNNVREWLHGDDVGSITTQDATLFQKLMDNAKLKDAFLTRYGQLLATTLSSENVVGRIKARYDLIKDEMKLNCKRWKWSTNTWNRYVKAMVKYAQARPAKLIGYLRDAFHLSDAQARHYFGEAMERAGM